MSQVETKRQGVKRPYIPVEAACRVEQFASKQGLCNREAYKQIVSLVLDAEGNLKDGKTES